MREKLVLIALFLISLSAWAQTPINCSVKSSCGQGETNVLQLSSTSNAHASSDDSYANKVCCKLSSVALQVKSNNDCNAENTFVSLSSTNNAHAAFVADSGGKFDKTSSDNYSNVYCLTATNWNVSCKLFTANYPSQGCVTTLSSSTNTHLAACGDSGEYPNRVFCEGSTTTTCTDADKDGFSIEGGSCGKVDCNDTNSSVNPGATEICDDAAKIDEDCDGAVNTDDIDCGGGFGVWVEPKPLFEGQQLTANVTIENTADKKINAKSTLKIFNATTNQQIGEAISKETEVDAQKFKTIKFNPENPPFFETTKIDLFPEGSYKVFGEVHDSTDPNNPKLLYSKAVFFSILKGVEAKAVPEIHPLLIFIIAISLLIILEKKK